MNEGIRCGKAPIELAVSDDEPTVSVRRAAEIAADAVRREREACAALIENLHEGYADLVAPRELADAIRKREELHEVTEADLRRARKKQEPVERQRQRELATRRYMQDATFHTIVRCMAEFMRDTKTPLTDLQQAVLLLEETQGHYGHFKLPANIRPCGCLYGLPHVEKCPTVQLAMMMDGEHFQDSQGNAVEPPSFIPKAGPQ